MSGSVGVESYRARNSFTQPLGLAVNILKGWTCTCMQGINQTLVIFYSPEYQVEYMIR